MHVNAGPGDAEYAETTLQMAALRRLADDTGGKAYTPATASALLEDVKYTGRGITAVEERELWNAPLDAGAAAGPPQRGMGVPACRRPLLAAAAGSRRRWPRRCRGGRRAWRRGTAIAVSPASASAAAARAVDYDEARVDYDGRFAFVRLRYDLGGGRGGFGGFRREPPWAHDYPRADRHLMKILRRSRCCGRTWTTATSSRSTTPSCTATRWPTCRSRATGRSTDAEAEGLRTYLAKGGFLIFDDFRRSTGTTSRRSCGKVLPAQRLVELDAAHPVFHAFFEIDPARFVSPYGGLTPTFHGIFEDNDPTKRLQVVANYNNDLGEYWEFSDTGWVPIDLSNEAYKFGVNYIVYGMTH